MDRPVTEFDLRADEFRHPDVKPDDMEFRSDGKIVRKDRWERGLRAIASAVGPFHRDWEIADVVARVQELADAARAIDAGDTAP